MKLKIGVLVPQSSIQPAIGRDIIDGIRVGMPESIFDENLFIEDIGLGHKRELVIEKSQKLVLQNDVDIVIAFLGNNVANDVRDYFHNNQKLLFIVNQGAKRTNLKPSPYVYYHHFGLWHSAYYSGVLAAEMNAKKALTICDFYESGYEFISAFHKAFTENHGIVERMLIDNNNTIDTYNELLSLINTQNHEVLFAAFSGTNSDQFLKFVTENKLHERIKIIITPTMTEYFQSGDSIEHTANYYCCNTWDINANTQDNKWFKDQYFKRRRKTPNSVTLLAYEVMMLLTQALQNDVDDIFTISDNLKGMQINSPRGNILMDKELNSSFFKNIYFLNTNETSKTNKIHKDIHQQFVMKQEDVFSGWMNPYLCI